jgi:hypothetical protein
MLRKKEFLLDKLQNFIGWLCSEAEVDEKSTIIDKLRSFQTDYNSFLQFLFKLDKVCDANGNISDDTINTHLADFKLDFKAYPQNAKDKFKRYIKCFVVASRT